MDEYFIYNSSWFIAMTEKTNPLSFALLTLAMCRKIGPLAASLGVAGAPSTLPCKRQRKRRLRRK